MRLHASYELRGAGLRGYLARKFSMTDLLVVIPTSLAAAPRNARPSFNRTNEDEKLGMDKMVRELFNYRLAYQFNAQRSSL